LPRDWQGVGQGQGAHGHSIRQRRAVDELHDERAVLDAVDLRDVRMVQRRQDFGFALEASAGPPPAQPPSAAL
jgi:hypothetical protein